MAQKLNKNHPFWSLGWPVARLAAQAEIPLRTIYDYLEGRCPRRDRAEQLSRAVDGRIPPEAWVWPEKYPEEKSPGCA
jgi:hypothetical protein